jgi:hypothetical protein
LSASDYPTTDADEIKTLLNQVLERQGALDARLDGQAAGINAIGENLTWLVQNTQGLFQMFASPQFVSQMTNMMMGAMPGGRQPGPEDSGTTGADNGRTGG